MDIPGKNAAFRCAVSGFLKYFFLCATSSFFFYFLLCVGDIAVIVSFVNTDRNSCIHQNFKMGSIPDLSILKGDKRVVMYKKKLHQEFEERLKTSQLYDAISIIFQENGAVHETSYRQLNEQANKIARVILQRGNNNHIPPNGDGDYIVAVCMQPSDRLLITLLAIWKSGAAYLPLEPSFPEQRIKHILKESKPIMIIHDDTADTDAFAGTLEVSYSILSKECQEDSSENIPENMCLKQSTENLALVLYTSGSTGVPKGVRLPHDIIQNRLQWQYVTFPFSLTEKICIFKTALTFVDSICEIWGPLLNGLAVLVVPKMITRDPERLIKMLTEYKIERLSLVPSLLRSMLLYLSLQPAENNLLSTLRLWISSGEALSAKLARDFFCYFGPGRQLCNFYGSTEIMADVTYWYATSAGELENMDYVPIGNPIFNTIIYLLDNDLRPVPIGEMGELWVSGSNLAAGYVNGRSPDRFINNPMAPSQEYSRLYRTGDFARISKGTVIFEGRTDSQIKIRGHRVDLTEVEKAVHLIEGIDKGVVLCYKPGEMDQALLAFVTCDPGSKLTGIRVENQLQDKLALYMIPQVIILDSIPLLVNGKNDRQALLKMYENTNNNDDMAIALDYDYSGIPASKMKAAEVLFQTIGSVIGRSTRNTVSILSNYYELGGNSLNSIYTIIKLKEQGYEIGITDFILAENLGEILDKITNEQQLIMNQKNTDSYTLEPLENKHKNEAEYMIVSSFYEKADLEMWLKPAIKREHYSEMIEETWSDLLQKDLSFIVRRQSDGLAVGVSLNFDARDEPAAELNNELVTIFEFLEFVEEPVRERCLPSGVGQILHSFMMATHPSLSAQENVSVIQFMEEELVGLAAKRGFAGIFTTNTSPITQQFGQVMGYEVMCDYQVNQFVSSSGAQPFGKAPDTQRAIVSWKPIK